MYRSLPPLEIPDTEWQRYREEESALNEAEDYAEYVHALNWAEEEYEDYDPADRYCRELVSLSRPLDDEPWEPSQEPGLLEGGAW